MPTLTALTTRTIYLISAIGMIATPFLATLVPNEQERAGIQIIFGVAGYLAHEIASKSKADGTAVEK